MARGDRFVAVRDHASSAPKWRAGEQFTVVDAKTNGFVRLSSVEDEKTVGVLLHLWAEDFVSMAEKGRSPLPTPATTPQPTMQKPASTSKKTDAKPHKVCVGDNFEAICDHSATPSKWRKGEIFTVETIKANGFVRLQSRLNDKKIGVLLDLWHDNFQRVTSVVKPSMSFIPQPQTQAHPSGAVLAVATTVGRSTAEKPSGELAVSKPRKGHTPKQFVVALLLGVLIGALLRRLRR